MKKYKSALVLGAGAFGTSIGKVLSNNFEEVIFKVRSADICKEVNGGENKIYLPGHKLASNMKASLSWEEIESHHEKIDLIVCALPTSALRLFFDQNYTILSRMLSRGVALVSLTKGIDPETLELPDSLFATFFSEFSDQLTFLSGPSFASEIMDEQITLVSLAGRCPEVLLKVSDMLATNYFKVFPSYDIKGTLLGGALKNILAISGGIIEGLGFNHNTRAAMITRGIAEMLRFGRVFNARPETFYGLSGMGDLILTSTGSLSRNKSFGLEIAKGKDPTDVIASQRFVVEGYKTTKAAYRLSERYKIRAHIFRGLYHVLYEKAPPLNIIEGLMGLPVNLDEY